ncbi:indolepyruvate ferredoxin oxidoreductase alpha subunit [Luminiphilus syltensis NOR5-1B]|uniref:Indolepyruvate ferredoxin oxidoreductase alpha subunit n=1 Tax=Luminiphilus syltensis NOR5-1B TaxID=565045 RepID=B8KTA7_9GAMM|nr:indolepyruvate ferredoxin oxidoreductase subunit alpha [Luminiphilus syltensis]EED35627.1 indolepyruvate ferredoxin oxidoreductase alpha subunit [Luminiphilus syltensis NOR5-1B]
MAERSFKEEVKKLRAGDGERFQGEGILAITKALLQSGVSYVGGYQGSPISHLMDVLNDAQDILGELGVHFEASGSEATAAAMLSASINYPLRGAVTWKSTVGTNVASDALSNIASSGVTGGAMVIVGEDYGEGSSIMQERSYAFAMKAQMWLLDPRPNLTSIVDMVEKGFELSEASNTPIFYMMRIRGCHVTGEFVARDNREPQFSDRAPVTPHREPEKIILPPNVYAQEREKIAQRLPAAIEFIKANKLNEVFPGRHEHLGIITCGGSYNTVIRALQRQGLSDVYGNTDIPIYVLNVAYPLIPEELVDFCVGKEQVLVLEEGQPEYIEQGIQTALRRADFQTRVFGKDIMPMAGEYTGQVMLLGITRFIEASSGPEIELLSSAEEVAALETPLVEEDQQALLDNVPPRPSGLCTGCPERPLFSAVKQVQEELGPFHISSDIGCHSFATLAPFNLGNTIMGYGLSLASSSSVRHALPHKAISIMGDGGFWHNGLTSGVASAVFNHHDGLLIVVDNGYSAATGGQDIPSLVEPNIIASTIDADAPRRDDYQSIEEACRGAGVKWIRTVSTYNIEAMKNTLHEALTSSLPGLKVVVAEGECMLNRQRRVKPMMKSAIASGKRIHRSRFYVDPQTCTGDHGCIRLSGCPSLTIKDNPDPLRTDPVSYVDNSCVGCGVCGENAHSAVLCPSFSQVDLVYNPNSFDRAKDTLRQRVIAWFRRRDEQRMEAASL